MSLIALGKAKSWGTTTAVMALANVWPSDRRLLVAECDPAGGDLAPRYGLALEPGLMSLAAAARRELSASTVTANTQRLPGGLAVLVAPPAAEQARAALSAIAGRLADAMRSEVDQDVLADCGRLDPGSPAQELVRSAALTVLVARATLEEATHVLARVNGLRTLGAEVVVVLVEDEPRLGGQRPYRREEVAAAVGAEVIGSLAHDPKGAALLAGRATSDRALQRCALIRSARVVAAELAARVARPAHELESSVPAWGTSTSSTPPAAAPARPLRARS
ncbi:MAG: chromosome partitioning protein [Actinobacteria bacterium]|nr:chromosome partitioning protein [Actinomycetota bacterium]